MGGRTRRERHTEHGNLCGGPVADGGRRPARPVATFRPPCPRTDEWAQRPNKETLREIGLSEFAATVERILVSSGLPPATVTGFETVQARCKVHLGSVRFSLRPPSGEPVQVTHCGCDHWLHPVDAPPEDTLAMAQDLADEVTRYWHGHAGTLAMVVDIAATCELEAAKARALGLDSEFVGATPGQFDTFRGPHQGAVAGFDLPHDNLFPQRWSRWMSRPADATQFFKSMRPCQVALAKRRDELAAAGATGAIDRLALAGLVNLGRDPLGVIARMAGTAMACEADLGGPKLVLRWRMRTIRGVLLMPPGVSWKWGSIHYVADETEYDGLVGYERIGEILSSPLLPRGTRLTCQKRHEDWIEADEPTCELFKLEDGVASWAETPIRG